MKNILLGAGLLVAIALGVYPFIHHVAVNSHMTEAQSLRHYWPWHLAFIAVGGTIYYLSRRFK